MIEVDNIGIVRSGVALLDGVSFSVSESEVVLLAGPNGSGKTMTLRCVAGLIRPSRGRVFVDGRDAYDRRLGPTDVFGTIGAPALSDWRKPIGHARATVDPKALAIVDRSLTELDVPRTRSCGRLSMGERHKVALAIAMAVRPRCVVLDEPTNGLDARSVGWLDHQLRAVRRAGRSVIVASHHLDAFTDVASRCVVLDRGRVVAVLEPSEWADGGLNTACRDRVPGWRPHEERQR